MAKRWTNQDIEDLKHMASRYSAPKIAELIDRTVGGVTFKAHELKLSCDRAGILKTYLVQ